MDDYIFSVAEYIELVNETLKVRKITIQGEITSFSARGGAVFFTIADPEEDALLECVVWKSVYENLGIELEEGMAVKIAGSASIYPKNGRFRFIAYSIVPLGEGALKKAFEKLKQKLLEAGYFDLERKKRLPEFVQNIGLITADKSDAKKDFETHIGKHGFKVYFHDVKVEGANSIKEIVKAFDYFNESTLKLDVLVLTRGGGSMESLMAFNSEDVAKAIFKSKIPVLCAVGHENDVSIADLVADLRASTPTHAGRIISQPYKDIQTILVQNTNQLELSFNSLLTEEKNKFKNYCTELANLYEQNINFLKQKIKGYQNTQMLALSAVLNTYRQLEIKFLANFQSFGNLLGKSIDFLVYSEKLLSANDPQHKLKQGYSITLNKNGKVLRNPTDAKAGDILVTKLFKGEISSKVQ